MLNLKLPISKGFTLIELGVVMGIFSTLVGIATINLLNTQHKTTLTASVNTFIADVKGQQLRAMVGDTDGQTSTNDYGVHIEESSYTLFRNTYGTSDSVINLPPNLEFAIPNTQVLFAKGSGEISGPVSIIIRDTKDGNQKTININKYGIVTGVN